MAEGGGRPDVATSWERLELGKLPWFGMGAIGVRADATALHGRGVIGGRADVTAQRRSQGTLGWMWPQCGSTVGEQANAAALR